MADSKGDKIEVYIEGLKSRRIRRGYTCFLNMIVRCIFVDRRVTHIMSSAMGWLSGSVKKNGITCGRAGGCRLLGG